MKVYQQASPEAATDGMEAHQAQAEKPDEEEWEPKIEEVD